MTPAFRPLPRVVLTYGCFDGLHQDQIAFLRDISRLGDEIIVGCATDALAEALGRPCRYPFETRRAVLQGCRYVGRVIPQIDPAQMRTDIVNYDAAAVAISAQDADLFEDVQDIAQIYISPRNFDLEVFSMRNALSQTVA